MISDDYQGEKLTLIFILKGSLYFFSDLSREINNDLELEFIRVSSYAGYSSTGKIDLKLDMDESVKDKNVIIIEDIVDPGKKERERAIQKQKEEEEEEKKRLYKKLFI